MKSVMKHSFQQAPSIQAPRSRFDLSHGHKTTFDAGWLVPLFWMEVMPGDTISCNLTALIRLATPSFPIMDNMVFDTQYFFMPDRLAWENSRKFYGEQDNPADSIDFTIPILSGTRDSDPEGDLTTAVGRTGRLLDYMGIPDGFDATDVDISAMIFRAYNAIYNRWYKDQNLQNDVTELTGDAADPDTTYELLRRGKRPDYFTSCLPWPQKGDSVSLPLGTQAPITGIGTATGVFASSAIGVTETDGSTPTYAIADDWNVAGKLYVEGDASVGGKPLIYADLTNATSSTINDIREAIQVQKLLERDARSGTRYSELVYNHFGVNFYDISNAPEFLGGGSSYLNVNPVAATTNSTDAARDLGDLAATGTINASGHTFNKSFVEHGYVLCIGSVRADLTYQQGLHRSFSKSTRYDKFWPSLAHLGEQPVYNKEIYLQGAAADDLVFGYQERYAEYRYLPSRISGIFRSTATASLDAWHLSQEFISLPTLGDTFIKENPPIDRVISVPTEPHFIFDGYFDIKAARPMPLFGVPGLIDHF